MMSCCEFCTSERQGEKEKFALLDGEMGKVEAQNKKGRWDVVSHGTATFNDKCWCM